MVTGCRHQVREDLNVVYYFRSDEDDNDAQDAGWYVENAENHSILAGPFDTCMIAIQQSVAVPTGGPCHLGDN